MGRTINYKGYSETAAAVPVSCLILIITYYLGWDQCRLYYLKQMLGTLCSYVHVWKQNAMHNYDVVKMAAWHKG